MKQKKVLNLTLAAALAASIGWVAWVSLTPEDGKSGDPASATENASPRADGSASAPVTQVSAAEEERRFLDDLRRRFGARIKEPYWQIQLMDFLRSHFMKLYPNDWASHVRDVLKKLFPDMANALLARFQAYSDYMDWMGQQSQRTFTDPAERKRALWDKRHALFGADADQIWREEIRLDKVATALDRIRSSTAPFGNKVDSLVAGLKDAYGDNYRQVDGQVKTTALMEEFLKLDSVQQDLRQQSPAQRADSLRKLRADLGMDQEALTRWEQLDNLRAQRRSAGEEYMAEKARLEKQFTGEALQVQVQGLQNRVFGPDEAQFIRNEEAAGYYRYKEKQTIGVN